MPFGLRFMLAAGAGGAALAGASFVFGCGPCPAFLEPGMPLRVVLIERYTDTATFTGYDEAFATSDLAMPSCGSLDGLATTTPTVVPGANERGGESCSVGASLAVDTPVAAEDNRDLVWSHNDVAQQPYYGNVETELAGCTGVWTFGLQFTTRDDPFADPVPGGRPPWFVVRSFRATQPCTSIPGVEGGATECVDFFAARLEPVTP